MQPCVVKLSWRNAVYCFQLVMAAAFATACERIVDPAFPPTATQFVPPSVYDRWWTMTESCSRASAPLAKISWYVVPGVSDFQFKGQTVSGYWTGGSNSIVLADSSQLDGSVVRHEMLHALVRTSGHPRSEFLQKCAGMVSCTSQCVADAGAAPTIDASVPTVPSDSIEVSLQLVPDQPSMAIDGGVFSLVVSARNPASHPVSVLLVNFGSGPQSFAFQIRAFTPGLRIDGALNLSDPSVATFAAGETKRQYFDFVIGSVVKSRTVSPGIYRITGSYGSRSSVLVPVTIASP